jgi:hypothetical protein
MKTQLAFAVAVVGSLVAPSVFPCGAPFGSGIAVNPQQDIIVAYKNGVETYVFQPTFCGTASNFGLILPVPAALTDVPALSDQQAFSTVDNLSQPKYVTVTSCSGGNTGIGGTTGGPPPSAADAGTTVVSSGHVGFLDWSQLKADSVASFTVWLTTNGYPYSDAASSVFSYYVQKGWYFVAFKIGRSVVDAGNTTLCSALGPVKLSFATTAPVVPSRMASAATASASSYTSLFSWRIFGITTGDQQLAFADGANVNRVLGYSGALNAVYVSSLAGLAQAGDRLTKLTLTFAYGSTDPDVGLSLASATDYREIRYITQYVMCPDASADAVADAVPVELKDATASVDWQPQPAPDAESSPDTGIVAVDADWNPTPTFDAQLASSPDAGPLADAGAHMVTDARASPDAVPRVFLDAGSRSDAPLALASVDAARDAAGTPTVNRSGGGWGCSVTGRPTLSGCVALTLVGLIIAGQNRRRRGRQGR